MRKLNDKTIIRAFALIASLQFLILGLIFTSPNQSKISFISESKDDWETELLKEFCIIAAKDFENGKINSRLFSKQAFDYLKETEKVEFTSKGVVKVFPKFMSNKTCKVITKRKDGFTGFNAVFSNGGEFGFQISTLISIDKLTINDVREFL